MAMLDQLKRVRELQEEPKTYRKRGDALRKVGREDAALEAYRGGLVALTDAVKILAPTKERVASSPPLPAKLPPELKEGLQELVETFGARGGLLQRLNFLKEASESYAEGAVLEQRFGLRSTYNRLNEVKSSLLSGAGRLRDFEPPLRELAVHLYTNLREDKTFSDSGWAWADLGDCLVLLGKVEEAREAYSSFISKAEIKSPERTLDVLKEIALRLEELADPDAPRLRAAIDILKSGISTQ
jgi:predicted RNA polymerase sigma factor